MDPVWPKTARLTKDGAKTRSHLFVLNQNVQMARFGPWKTQCGTLCRPFGAVGVVLPTPNPIQGRAKTRIWQYLGPRGPNHKSEGNCLVVGSTPQNEPDTPSDVVLAPGLGARGAWLGQGGKKGFFLCMSKKMKNCMKKLSGLGYFWVIEPAP